MWVKELSVAWLLTTSAHPQPFSDLVFLQQIPGLSPEHQQVTWEGLGAGNTWLRVPSPQGSCSWLWGHGDTPEPPKLGYGPWWSGMGAKTEKKHPNPQCWEQLWDQSQRSSCEQGQGFLSTPGLGL